MAGALPEATPAAYSALVRVPAPRSSQEDLVQELPVLYEDDHLIVIDKPVGVAAHPSTRWVGPTVSGQLAAQGVRIATSGAPERQGIVHRLDVGTSGAMVVAKSEQAYSGLKRAFHDRTPTKVYHAVVQGLPDPLKGTIDAPIGRHPGARWRFAVTPGQRESCCQFCPCGAPSSHHFTRALCGTAWPRRCWSKCRCTSPSKSKSGGTAQCVPGPISSLPPRFSAARIIWPVGSSCRLLQK